MNVRRLTRSLWTQWIRPLALPVLLITAAKSALADINYVPSGSMEPTLLAGEVVFINKLAYDFRVPFTFARLAHWAEPARGDIVVCFAPDDGMRLVKRVVGLRGDTIEMRHDILYINGSRLAYLPLDPAVGHYLAEDERRHAAFAQEQLGRHSHAVMALPVAPSAAGFRADDDSGGVVPRPRGQSGQQPRLALFWIYAATRDHRRGQGRGGFSRSGAMAAPPLRSLV